MNIIRSMRFTDTQMGIYLECINDENSLKYNIATEYKFGLQFDFERLKAALETVLHHYVIFSSGITVANGEPRLVQYDKCTVGIESAKVTETEYANIRNAFEKPFAFDGSPLYRIGLYATEAAVYLLVDAHHLVADGASCRIFQKALEDAYYGKAIPAESATLFDEAEAETAHAQSPELQISRDYFAALLDGVDVDSNLLPDRAEPENGKCAMLKCSLPVSVSRVKQFAKDRGLTANVVLLAAFAYALAKTTNQDSTLFTSINSGRRGKPLENTLGFFVHTFPLYFKIDEEYTIDDYLASVRKHYIDTMSHDDVPFAELSERFGVRSDIKYVYQGDLEVYEFGGESVGLTRFDCDDALSNLDVIIFESGDTFSLRFNYRTAMYSEAAIRAFADLYSCIAEGILTEKRLRDISLVSETVLRFIDDFNATEQPYDEAQTVWDILASNIRDNAGKPAVCYKDTAIRYCEFDALTSDLAAYIASKGIGRNDFVAVLIPRNEFMAVTAWAIVRAGAAYQPLDPAYPKDRLNFMVKDAGAKLLIADRALRGLLDEYDGDVLYTDEIASLPHVAAFAPADRTDGALVIIYTSGTTGVPKGCVLENRNIVCFHHNHVRTMGLSGKSHVANYASFGFDAGIQDIFTTLMVGATLYVIPDDIRLDIAQIDTFYRENSITHGFMTTQVGRMFAEITKSETLQAMMVGGEKLVPFDPPKRFKVINGYGPSETIAYVCHHVIQDASAIQPIGTASGNTKLYVVDRYSRLLPYGACGELCISGNQVGRGYLNRPDKTAEVFVPNPFSDKTGYERMYRTGDIVRLLPCGEMDFVGRRDAQVKIRGFRVELTEVEQVIREYPIIKGATVQAFDAPSGGKYIAAYVVADVKVDIAALNDFIRAQKPDYMVPEVTMQLEAIPLNVNGKVDKRKLPVPQRAAAEIKAPQTDTQKRILEKVAEVIGHEDIGVDTSLFAAGLSSIGVIRLNVKLADAFNVSLSVRELRENDTVEKLEALITSKSEVEAAESVAETDYPLTGNQEGILVECMSDPESVVYNIPLLLKIGDTLDIGRLKNALVEAVSAHSYMLTSFFADASGKVRQKRDSRQCFAVNDIEEITADSIEQAQASLLKPFKLLGGRLFRFALIRANGLYLYFDVHHIIADGTSVNLLLSDIERAYNGGTPDAEKFTGFDFAAAEQKRLESGELAKAKAHYEKTFSDADADFLPAGDLRPDTPRDSGTYARLSSPERVQAVEAFCRNHELSVNAVMLSVFGYVLAKYNAEDYAVFTTVYNGRIDSRTDKTFAMLVKTLPVYVGIKNAAPVDLAAETSNQLLESMVNDLYAFSEINHDLGIRSDVMFIYQGADFVFNSFCGQKAEIVELNVSDKKSPISLQVYLENGRYAYKVDYECERFSESFIAAFTDAFDCALADFVTKDNLRDVALVSREMQAKLDAFNETEAHYDETLTMASWFERTARAYPENIAVECEGRQYTYAQVEDLSARLAAYLIGKGIQKDEFVPILVDRNEFMPICAEGVIRAGAGYEPLDPAYPIERLRFMVEDAEAKLVIADRSLADVASGFGIDILYTDEIAGLPEAPGFVSAAIPDNKFVIIYTSGTTGLPKGNMLAHRQPVALFNFHNKDAKLTPDCHTAYFTGFSFDAGMLDLHASLLSGGTLHIIPEEIRRDPIALEQFFCDRAITHSCMTTQMGSMFVKMTKCKTLRYFTVGGEKLVPFTPPSHIRFVNGYGPSECTVYASGYTVIDDARLQPIGKPNDNIKLYIVDRNGHRLPFGAAGELCIAGRQVGLGYRNRPEKTREVFTENPFTEDPHYARLYHTGDVVRELTDGNYDFVGRKDGQVKIRGYRVELTEIEQIIRDYADIDNATVQAYDDPKGGKYIGAFVVSKKAIDFNDLGRFIGQSKPSYMIPAAFMQLERIPMTANGKVDKRALPTPVRKAQTAGTEPADETEEAFCDIFAEVLGYDKVYANDDFFAIGGSSITAAQVVIKCDAAGFNVVFKNLFENPTPRQLAALVKAGKAEDTIAPSGAEKEKYDYSCLQYNVPENLPKISYTPVGDVLLTGVTGYLGSHVYRAYMEMTDNKVICLVRRKNSMSAEDRFQMTMTYYFEDWYNETYAARTVVVDADLMDTDIDEKLGDLHFDAIINNAANVKHFAKGDSLVKDNFESVEHLIALAERRNAKLIQASSLSVCGESVNGSIPQDFRFREFNLNIGQSLENRYVYSKYLAEQAIIDAISRGRIRGKIIRLGNLAARDSDGEFQINSSNSGLLKIIQGYIKLGCYPVDAMAAGLEFSPIDKVAEAMVLLSGTPDAFTVFHAKNCHEIHYGYFVNALRSNGHKIDIVENDVFEARLKKALSEEEDVTAFTGFIAYLNQANESIADVMPGSEQKDEKRYETRVKISSDTAFTVKALYRLGFAWPLTDKTYLENMVKMLDDKIFFG